MMVQQITLLVSLAVLFHHCDRVRSHGRLIEPPGRSTMWRYGFNTPHNYNDNQLFCGGSTNQWKNNGGKCGVCGDPYEGPRENEAGGKYATGTISRQYKKGTPTILAQVEITANHRGYFEFRLCPHNSPTTPVQQECLDTNLLKINGSENTRYYIGTENQVYSVTLRIPTDLTCTQCVLQWKYNTGNSWGCDPLGCGLGLGEQEQFYGCSDIAILDIGDDNTTPLTKSTALTPNVTSFPRSDSTTLNANVTSSPTSQTTTSDTSSKSSKSTTSAIKATSSQPAKRTTSSPNVKSPTSPELTTSTTSTPASDLTTSATSATTLNANVTSSPTSQTSDTSSKSSKSTTSAIKATSSQPAKRTTSSPNVKSPTSPELTTSTTSTPASDLTTSATSAPPPKSTTSSKTSTASQKSTTSATSIPSPELTTSAANMTVSLPQKSTSDAISSPPGMSMTLTAITTATTVSDNMYTSTTKGTTRKSTTTSSSRTSSTIVDFTDCWATGAYEGQDSITQWCLLNCPKGYCPATHCKCRTNTQSVVKSDTTGRISTAASSFSPSVRTTKYLPVLHSTSSKKQPTSSPSSTTQPTSSRSSTRQPTSSPSSTKQPTSSPSSTTQPTSSRSSTSQPTSSPSSMAQPTFSPSSTSQPTSSTNSHSTSNQESHVTQSSSSNHNAVQSTTYRDVNYCEPSPTYQHVPNMKSWCIDNCSRGFCPKTHCVCR